MKKILLVSIVCVLAIALIYACKPVEKDNSSGTSATTNATNPLNPKNPNQQSTTSYELNENVKVEFDKPDFDFEEALEGEIIKHTYVIKNPGTELLKIYDVRTSCGCTALTGWPKELKPGESGDIKIEYNTTNRPGPSQKTITVKTNSKEKPETVLNIKGTVTAFIVVDPNYVSFGRVQQGETRFADIKVSMNKDLKENFKIKEVSSDKEYMKLEFKEVSKNEYKITGKLDIAKATVAAKEERDKRLANLPSTQRTQQGMDVLNFYGNITITTDNEKKKDIRVNFNGTIAE